MSDHGFAAFAMRRGSVAIRSGCLLLFLFAAGCHAMAKRPPASLGDGRNVQVEVVAWDPPGLLVTTELAAFPEPSTGQIRIPLKPVRLLGNQTCLRDGLDSAYDLERLRSLEGAAAARIAVLHRRGSREDLIPLPLVMRYSLGELSLTDGDLIGLVEWDVVGIAWQGEETGEPAAGDTVRVAVSGLVESPGTYALETPRLSALAGDAELPAGHYLKQTTGMPLADVLVVHRIVEQRVQRIMIPNELAATSFPLEAESFWDRLAGFCLQDGDAVVAMQSDWIRRLE